MKEQTKVYCQSSPLKMISTQSLYKTVFIGMFKMWAQVNQYYALILQMTIVEQLACQRNVSHNQQGRSKVKNKSQSVDSCLKYGSLLNSWVSWFCWKCAKAAPHPILKYESSTDLELSVLITVPKLQFYRHLTTTNWFVLTTSHWFLCKCEQFFFQLNVRESTRFGNPS